MMKQNYILAFFLCSFLQSCLVFAQQTTHEKEELENFLVITDQDFYLTGDRVWFAAKLLKNHESYRYSKLAYISILDASGNQIHQEKMLLTGHDMIFGDFFISESIPSGVFSIAVYTKWMSNFEDFPIAKKEFLVVNPTAPKPAGDPALFWEKTPYASAPVSILHTSDQPEVIEIQDRNGKMLEVLDAVPPLQKTLSTVKPSDGYRLIFRNKEFEVEPEAWYWDPADFSLNMQSEPKQNDLKIITHTDWMILEEINISDAKSLLNKEDYQKLGAFRISVLSASNEVMWSYQVQLPEKNSGQMEVSSRGKVGEEMKLVLVGFRSQMNNGIVLASMGEDPSVLGFAEILNHPNWQNLSSEDRSSNLISSLSHEVASPLLLKDYSPMFDYKAWSTDIYSRFPSALQKAEYSFFIPDVVLKAKLDRRVYQDHFEVAPGVVRLQSPFVADKVYVMEDYHEFPDLESFLKETVPQIRLRKASSGGGKEIFVANTDNETVKFNKKPLVLIDFYRPLTSDAVWNIAMNSLDRIEIYYHRSTLEATNLGESTGDGLIVLYTKNNEYFLKNNLPKANYFLADVSVPRLPDYSDWKPLVSANSLQFIDSAVTFVRGRGKSENLKFDTGGNWLVEAWLFSNSEFERVQKWIQIDP